MRARAKYAVICCHRAEYPVSVMCRLFEVSRSGYYRFVHRLGRMEKDAELAEKIRQQQDKCFHTYGYRRLKTECIYRHKPDSFSEANEMIDRYIYFCNHKRIHLKTGLAPLSLRQSY